MEIYVQLFQEVEIYPNGSLEGPIIIFQIYGQKQHILVVKRLFFMNYQATN